MNVLDYSLDRDDLCSRLGGGLPRGALVVVRGEYGAGKSVLVQRVTAGLLENGHSVSMVTTEMTTKSFFQQMESLCYKINRFVMSEQLVLVPTHPVIGARAPKGELLERLAKARLLYDQDVIIFDAFSKFIADATACDDRTALRERLDGLLHLFKRLANAGRTIILTLEGGQAPHEMAGAFIEAADVFLELDSQVMGSTAVRRIIVRRMSRAAHRFAEIVGFRVEPGIGIVVEIRSVV